MLCGCFACLHTFMPHEVIDWVDDGVTPLCPTCGADAVMPGVTDIAELLALHRKRYGRLPYQGVEDG